ncbi:MAG: MucB/RseB C-terminal domain-containing protein [Halothiobacillaceae bacterium]
MRLSPRRSAVLFSTFLSLLVLSPAHAEEGARERIERMVEAMRESNFEGVYVHVRSESIESMEVVHAFDGDHEIERLTALNGEIREVIRDDDTCRCTWPNQKTVVEGRFPGARARISAERFSKPELLQENYRIMSVGRDRVAGRYCDLIALVPKDDLRFGYKLCIDSEHDLMLRMSVFDESGMAVEHNFFTRLEVSDQLLDAQARASRFDTEGFEIVRSGAANPHEAAESNDEELAASAPQWAIDPLPTGYVLKEHVRRSNPVTGNAFEHYAFTDGLSTISVFVEPAEGQSIENPRLRMSHAVHTQTRTVGDHRVTVIGEAPQQVVEMFCESVRPVTDE